MKPFDKILKELLKEYGISQNELSKRLGLAQSTVNGWGLGIKEPGYNAILKICSELDIEPNELFNWNEETKQEIKELIKDDYMQKIDELTNEFDEDYELYDIVETQENSEHKAYVDKQLKKYNCSLLKWWESENAILKAESPITYEKYANYYKKLDKILKNMKVKYPNEYYHTIYTKISLPITLKTY